MANTSRVRGKLTRREQPDQTPAQVGSGDSIAQLIERQKPAIARALPRTMSPERFARVVLTTLRQNPDLLTCDQSSLLGALMLSAQLGLEPGPLGHAYFVPFRNRKTNRREVQWILGYKGLVNLARRSGMIETIGARVVYAADLEAPGEFDVQYGVEDRLIHRPNLDAPDPGELRYVYAVAKYVGGGHNFVVLSRAQVEKFRARSSSPDSPAWKNDYDAMAMKTAARRLQPWLPLSVELADALAADEQTAVWTGEEATVVDVEAVDRDDDTDDDSGDGGGEAVEGGPDRLLVHAVTGRPDLRITQAAREQVDKAQRLIDAGTLQLVPDGPEGEPVLVDRDGAVVLDVSKVAEPAQATRDGGQA